MGISPEEFFAIVRAGIAGQALSGEQDRGMTVGTESCCWHCHWIRAFATEKSMSKPLDAFSQMREVWRDEFSFRVSMRDRSTFRAVTPEVGVVAVRVWLTGLLKAAAAIKTPDIALPYVPKRNLMPLRVVRMLSADRRRKRMPPRSETGFESGQPVHFAKTGIEPFFTNFKGLTYFLAFE